MNVSASVIGTKTKLTHIVKYDIDAEGKLSKWEKPLDQEQLDGRAIEGPTFTTDHEKPIYAKIDHLRKKAMVLRVEVE